MRTREGPTSSTRMSTVAFGNPFSSYSFENGLAFVVVGVGDEGIAFAARRGRRAGCRARTLVVADDLDLVDHALFFDDIGDDDFAGSRAARRL